MKRTIFYYGNGDQESLWCAASEGDLERVRYLVEEEGANVNGTDKDGTIQLIPVRTACQSGHLEVVKYLVQRKADLESTCSYGETCLMVACYAGHSEVVSYLLSCDVQHNRQCIRGKTALHYCVEGKSSGQEEVMHILMNKGTDIMKDKNGLTPLHAAAICGQTAAVHYLMASDLFTPEQQAEALELLGAWHARYKDDYHAAVHCWCQALEWRKENGVEKVRGSPMAIYLNAVEAQEVDDYILMANNPDQIHLQALFLLERVLGPSHPEIGCAIPNYVWHCACCGDYERSMRLGMYTLESAVIHQEPLSHCFMKLFRTLVMSFRHMFLGRSTVLGSEARKNSFVEPLVRLIELALHEIRRYQVALLEDRAELMENETHRLLTEVLCLISVVDLISVLSQTTTPSTTLSPTSVPSLSIPVANLPHTLASSLPQDSTVSYRFRRALYNLVKTRVCGKGGATLLHIAYFICDMSHFPILSIVKLLLHVGADPNVRDLEGRTPLHVVCSQPGQIYMPLVQALLDGGAHVDIRDKNGVSPLDRLRSKEQRTKLCPVANTTLQCLAARVIARNPHLIPDLYRNQLSEELENFINMH